MMASTASPPPSQTIHGQQHASPPALAPRSSSLTRHLQAHRHPLTPPLSVLQQPHSTLVLPPAHLLRPLRSPRPLLPSPKHYRIPPSHPTSKASRTGPSNALNGLPSVPHSLCNSQPRPTSNRSCTLSSITRWSANAVCSPPVNACASRMLSASLSKDGRKMVRAPLPPDTLHWAFGHWTCFTRPDIRAASASGSRSVAQKLC
ncbi:hypothetical protein BCR44DRAFT_1256202 [Catenaria anguillulae PL171]|uniref:Uncharacterized protein n=1 Tax=Catenaria anguillulae PL171 TaxID=765915 RepID=A0A1Y2HBQ5_9FUNG|nr:hypothetical protein BCR44DRAFT_1256202 [Catenaria anguillulae PL171]